MGEEVIICAALGIHFVILLMARTSPISIQESSN